MMRNRSSRRSTTLTNEAKTITRGLCSLRILHQASIHPIFLAELLGTLNRRGEVVNQLTLDRMLRRMEHGGLLRRVKVKSGLVGPNAYTLTLEGRGTLNSGRKHLAQLIQSGV